MPISIMVVKVKRFYDKGYSIGGQEQFIGNDGLGLYEGEGHLFIDPTNDIISYDDSKFYVYNVDYDHRYETKGFVFDRPFSYFFKNYRFKIFYEKNQQLMILAVKKEIAKAFLKEISKEKMKSVRLYQFENLKIDYDRIVSKAENLSGLWAQVNRTEVQTQAYFGDNINLDEEVKLVLKEKDASYALLESTIGDNFQKIGITKEGNIVLFEDYSDDQEMIKNIYGIYKYFF
jgi:hypothetical protein